MSRGGSHGGGQSSLGYLFGRDDDQKAANKPTITSPPFIAQAPPYGTDSTISEKSSDNPSPPLQQNQSGVSFRSPIRNAGSFLTDRPSTKVNSVPGGDSSLGYLFGNK